MKEENIVEKKSFEFAVRIVRVSQWLQKEKREFVLSKQLLRSGTSIGANVSEALGGLSKADFSAKIGISYKETRETIYWLRLLNETGYLDDKLFKSLFSDAEELAKILYSIVTTCRGKAKKKQAINTE